MRAAKYISYYLKSKKPWLRDYEVKVECLDKYKPLFTYRVALISKTLPRYYYETQLTFRQLAFMETNSILILSFCRELIYQFERGHI